MKKIILLLSLAALSSGCNSYRHFMGRDHEGSGENNPGTVHTIAESGILPASNSLTFAPAFDASETLTLVRVRIAGTLTTISATPSAGVYYTFDGATLAVLNYDAAANLGGFSDNFAAYYTSPHPAGYHTVN